MLNNPLFEAVPIRIPLSPPIEKPRTAMVPGFFFCFFAGEYPLIYPLQVQNVLDIGFHTRGALPLHLVGDVSVYVQGKGRGGVAQIALDGFYIIPGADCGHGVTMPQVMEAGIGAADGGHHRLERIYKCAAG